MKLAMAQMRMEKDAQKNIEASVKYIEEAAKGGADLIFFPEVQLTQFFPKFEGRDAKALALTLDSPEITAMREAYMPDGLHPNDSGHAIIARKLAAFLKQQ